MPSRSGDYLHRADRPLRSTSQRSREPSGICVASDRSRALSTGELIGRAPPAQDHSAWLITVPASACWVRVFHALVALCRPDRVRRPGLAPGKEKGEAARRSSGAGPRLCGTTNWKPDCLMDHLVQIILPLAAAAATMIVSSGRARADQLHTLVGLTLHHRADGHVARTQGTEPEFAWFSCSFHRAGLFAAALHAMRHQILGLGTAQVVLTTALVAVALAGWPAAGARLRRRRCLRAVRRPPSSAASWREQGEDVTAHVVWPGPFRCSRMSYRRPL